MLTQKKLLLIVCSILFLVSCKDEPSKDIVDVIPTDASYVIAVDGKILAEKSQYDLFKNPQITQLVSYSKMLAKGDQRLALLDQFVNNSDSLGFTIKNQIYFFGNTSIFGAVLSVNNPNKLKESLVKLLSIEDSKIEKDGSVNVYMVDNDFCVAWDAHKLLFLRDTKDILDVKETDSKLTLKDKTKALLSQTEKTSIRSNKNFDNFDKNKKDISIFGTASFLKEINSLSKILPYTNTISLTSVAEKSELYEGLSMGLFCSFEKGSIDVTSHYYFDTPELEAKFKARASSFVSPLTGSHLKYLKGDPALFYSVNLKGQSIYQELNASDILKQIQGKMSGFMSKDELAYFIQNTEGDFTIALTSLPTEIDENLSTNSSPNFFIMLDMKDADKVSSFISEKVKEFGKDIIIKSLGNNQYYIRIDQSIAVFFGVSGNTLYITNMRSVYDDLNNSSLLASSEYTNLINGNSMICFGDASYFMNLQNSLLLDISPSLLGQYSFVINANTYEFSGKQEMVDKDQNSLVPITSYLDTIVSQIIKVYIPF